MVLHHKGTETIETDRLVLRKFAMDDANDMFMNWVNDIEVVDFLTWDPHGCIEVTQELLTEWIAAYEKTNTYNWAIVFKDNNEVIGSITVIDFSDKDLKCEIGYCLSKHYWSKGIITEALKAVIKFLFLEVGVNRIQLQHDTRNIASGKVMEKAGCTLEGTLRQRKMYRDGTIGDGHIWAILRDDYVMDN